MQAWPGRRGEQRQTPAPGFGEPSAHQIQGLAQRGAAIWPAHHETAAPAPPPIHEEGAEARRPCVRIPWSACFWTACGWRGVPAAAGTRATATTRQAAAVKARHSGVCRMPTMISHAPSRTSASRERARSAEKDSSRGVAGDGRGFTARCVRRESLMTSRRLASTGMGSRSSGTAGTQRFGAAITTPGGRESRRASSERPRGGFAN